MNSILLVDDDPVIIRIYRDGLVKQGFAVRVAADGLAAITLVREESPDVVVLDLMMPKLSGADFLKFLRGQPALKAVKVVVLCNSYMNELGREAARAGVDRGLLKVRCTPPLLATVIREMIEGKPASDPSTLLSVAETELGPARPQPAASPAPAAAVPAAPAQPALAAPQGRSSGQPNSSLLTPVEPDWTAQIHDQEARQKARGELMANVPYTCQALGDLLKGFLNAEGDRQRSMRVRDLYRKVHFITAMAGLADCPSIGQMCSAFEALLFEVMARPGLATPSVIATIKLSLDFLGELLQRVDELACRMPIREEVLVVDDDRLTNRLVVSALREAHLQASSTDSANTALQWAQQRNFHLFLLDIEMPGMDGYELCTRLRALPEYGTTPVIYVTCHTDFESRSRSVLSGGNDLIAKPVLPMELAVKSVMHLLKTQLALA